MYDTVGVQTKKYEAYLVFLTQNKYKHPRLLQRRFCAEMSLLINSFKKRLGLFVKNLRHATPSHICNFHNRVSEYPPTLSTKFRRLEVN